MHLLKRENYWYSHYESFVWRNCWYAKGRDKGPLNGFLAGGRCKLCWYYVDILRAGVGVRLISALLLVYEYNFKAVTYPNIVICEKVAS